MRSGFWKSDWFLVLLLAVVWLVAQPFGARDFQRRAENAAYDMGVRATSRAPSEKIAVIAIDDTSVANIGRWPWPRDKHAQLTDILVGAKAKVVANTVFLFDSATATDPGYQYITKLLELATRMESAGRISAEQSPLIALLKQAESGLNTDRRLAESYAKAGNVLLPMLFTIDIPRGKPDKTLPDFVARNAIPVDAQELGALPASEVQFPIEMLGRTVAGMGHLNANLDVDGGIRTEPLVLRYFDTHFPSLSAVVAAKSLNLGPADIKIRANEGVTLGRLRIGTDPALQMYTYFYKDRDNRSAFQVDSFYDVITGKIPASKYADKIVLIGATAAGVGTTSVTPVSPAMAPVLTLAHSVSSILQEHFFVAPAWAYMVEILVLLLVWLYLALLLPQLRASVAAIVTAGLLAAFVGTHFVLMISQGVWVQFMTACLVLLFGHLALVTKRFIVTEAAKVKSDESSAESNRMLGIAYQAQGQLDLAWDKFRQVPMSDAVMDNLYNLALDFERKRQFNKAESVFRHMHLYNPKFKDLEQKLSRAKQLSETVILGGGSTHPGGSLNLAAGEKPKFGRFEVQKELGKGAMGVVYLGKDPKIGREVAIKTMALSQEFEAEELTEVKERFFREAETAGRLSHPNIVTIYDTGEEHDFCYIAMELLKGGDLAPYVKADKLLPAGRAISIVARAADALGYAHKQGVVHRDIKPANMMYHAGTDTLKLTDFGIARLTDSSKTKTGMVLGTPSYMSPEQLAGRKIEGRSDLFSLAVSLYQMLCGKLPFEGESMAQLMYKIANEPPTAILSINPGVPPALVSFLDRALAKNPDQRFQSGDEFAAALRAAARGTPAAAGAARPAAPLDIEL